MVNRIIFELKLYLPQNNLIARPKYTKKQQLAPKTINEEKLDNLLTSMITQLK